MRRQKLLEAAVLAAFFIVFIGGGILACSPLALADNCVRDILGSWRSESGTRFLADVTFLGNWRLILVLTVVFSLILKKRRERRYILSLWIVVAGSLMSAGLIKFILPYRGLEGSDALFSFPSGHSTAAVAFYGFLACFLRTSVRAGWTKRVYPVIPIAAAALVGFSRLYLEVHLFSDVLGGSLLGAAWILIGNADMDRWHIGFKIWSAAAEFARKFRDRWSRIVPGYGVPHGEKFAVGHSLPGGALRERGRLK